MLPPWAGHGPLKVAVSLSWGGSLAPDGGRLPLREDSPGHTPAMHTLQVQVLPRPRLPVCSRPPPVMSGSEVTKLQILSAFPFINVTFKAPLAQVNHNYISKGLWYHSKSSDSQSCQWKALRSDTHTLTQTHTHTRCKPFPLLFFFSAWFLNEAVTLSFFPATPTSFPLPGRLRRAQGRRGGFSTSHSSQRKWQGCERKPGLDRPASGACG